MGVAAALLPHGLTICAATGLQPLHMKQSGETPKASDDNRATFATACGPPDEIALIVMDEVSTYGPKTLCHSSRRFCEFLSGDSTTPFGGGVVVLLPGDFVQLPPVGEQSLYQAVVKFHLNGLVPSAYGKKPLMCKLPRATSADTQGVTLFVKFRMSRLREQMRARLDEAHCIALEAVRELDAVQPISDELIARLVQQVASPAELATPLSVFALMVSVSQKEVSAYNFSRMRLFARFRGVPLVRWKVKLPEGQLQFRNKEQVHTQPSPAS